MLSSQKDIGKNMIEDNPVYTEAYEMLKNAELFGDLDTQTLKSLLTECIPINWRKTDTIDSEIGTKYLHIIIKGRLKVTQIDPHTGRSIALFLLSEGDVFDVFSLLDGKEHVVFPIAMDNISALRIPLKRAREWICEHPEFNKKFLPYLGDKMRELEAFGESLVFNDTATRLSKLILKHVLPEKEAPNEPYHVKLINNLSHESLAEMIGSVRSVVSSQMHKLKEEEVILSKRGHLAVKNLEKLIEKTDYFK